MTQIQDTHGNSQALNYAGNLLTQVSDGLGRSIAFTHDPQGRVISASDGTRTTSYSYSAMTGELVSYQDALGQTTQYAYAPGPVPGLLTSVTLPGGSTPFTVSYDPQQGRVVQVTNAFGAIWSYGAKTVQSPLGVSGEMMTPSGGLWLSDYDDRLNRVRRVDPLGGVTNYAYDAQDRIVSVAGPVGNVTQITYDPPSGFPSSVQLPDGTVTGFTYTPRNVGGITLHDRTGAHYPDGSTAQWAFDASGNMTQYTDPVGHPWMYAYNARGQVTQATIPGGGTTQYGYDPVARLDSRTDASLNTTTYQYDGLDRLIRVIHPDLQDREFIYDALNRPLTLTNELNKTWTLQWTPNNRLQLWRDPLLQEHQFAYDAMDRRTSWTDPLAGVTQYAYDAAGRLVSRTDRTGRTMTYGYDTMDRLVAVTDPGGNATQFVYDANSRVIQVTDPLTHTRQYGWDGLDRLVSYTDPSGTMTQYSYDAVNRKVMITPPLGDPLTHVFDSRGLRERSFYGSSGSPSSEVLFFTTPFGRLQSWVDPNGNTWDYGYDAQARRTSFTDPLGRVTSYAYDARSRLIQKTTPMGPVTYAYDAASRLTSRTLGGGPALTYSYDDANRVVGGTGLSLTYDAAGRVTSSQGVNYAYDAEGRLTGITFAPSRVVSYSYDTRGLLSTVQEWVGGTTQFTYDAAGNRMQMTRPNGTAARYEYDALDRLIRIADVSPMDSIGSISLGRNARGWVTSATRKVPHPPNTWPPGGAFAYDPAGQIVGFTYDGNGRLLQDGVRNYQWDVGSRLVQLNQPSGPVFYGYDCLDRMANRNDPSGPRGLVWNEVTGRLHVERQGPTDLRYRIQTPEGLYLHTIDAGTGGREFYHLDEVGNVIALTSETGSIETSYRYDAYGRSSSLGLTSINPFTYRGGTGVYTEGSGLYRFGTDLYDAGTARFISLPTVVHPDVPPNPIPNFNPKEVQIDKSVLWTNKEGSGTDKEVNEPPRLPPPRCCDATEKKPVQPAGPVVPPGGSDPGFNPRAPFGSNPYQFTDPEPLRPQPWSLEIGPITHF